MKLIQNKILFLLVFFNVFFVNAYAENNLYDFSSQQEARRFQHLTNEIRCLVCQNQAIADSNAPLAVDLRYKIYRMIQAQQSDAEIKYYLEKRYGAFILLQPRFNAATFLLWSFPLFAFCTAIAWMIYWRRSHDKINRSSFSGRD